MSSILKVNTIQDLDGNLIISKDSGGSGFLSPYASSSAAITYTVTVASKTSAHPYFGVGSSNGYLINGIEAPIIEIKGNDTSKPYHYKFDQSDSTNNGHPLLFYNNVGKTTQFTTGVTTNGTPGQAGAYTMIAVDSQTPNILYYQCSQHANMGNHTFATSPVVNTGVFLTLPTADGSSGQFVKTNGSGVLAFADGSVPDNAITLAKMASGTDGNIISYDTSGNPVAVATGNSGQVLTSAGAGAIPTFATIETGTTWQSVITASTLTTVAGRGYAINTTSNACTVTLPGSASLGDTIQIVDYAGKFGTNNITLTSSLKIEGGTTDKKLITNREGVSITFIDSTQGWVATSGVNSGDQALDPLTYTADFLVIAGGGGGGSVGGAGVGGTSGAGAGGYRNSFGSETSGGGASSESSLIITPGIQYTVTIGGGGAGAPANQRTNGTNGVNSSLSGTGITTITSVGGGSGAAIEGTGGAGGSGGGAGSGSPAGSAGSGTANQGFAGGGPGGGNAGGGGGGAAQAGNAASGETGGAGGNGLASAITGSSVTRTGGGGGGVYDGRGPVGAGGSGGGGAGGNNNASYVGGAGTVNTGSGGGGGGSSGGGVGAGGAGGKGVIIISMLDASYSGTVSGSPTVATGVSGKTVLTFNSSGSFTG